MCQIVQHCKCYKCFGFNRREIKIERGENDNIFVEMPKNIHTLTQTIFFALSQHKHKHKQNKDNILRQLSR